LLKNTGPDISFNMNYYHDNATRQQKELAFNPEKGTILLKGVEIKASGESAFSRSFGEYIYTDKTILVKKEDYSYYYLVDYLMDKVPYFVREIDRFLLRNKPVDFMVDNLEFDYREVEVIRMQDMKQIDIIDPGYIKPGTLGGINLKGLISAYRKDPNKVPIDYFNKRGRVRPSLRGFQEPVRFYSPSYTPEYISSLRPDYRPTLLWNPELRFENGKADIGFYTSDQLARYVVFVEGITNGGKICFGTTSFTVDKN